MLQNPCKSTRFYPYSHDNTPLSPPLPRGDSGGCCAFWQKAGRLSVRAVRCRWQGFFSTSALSDEDIFCNRWVYIRKRSFKAMFSISKHKIMLAILDIVVTVFGFYYAFWYVFVSGMYQKPMNYPIYYLPSITLIVIIFLIVFQLAGLYKYQTITNPVYPVTVNNEVLPESARFLLTIGLGFLISFLLMVITRCLMVPKIYFYLVKKRYW